MSASQKDGMKLRVVSWNMDHWKHRSVARRAWEYLEKDIAADIMLVQEAAPPRERQNENCVWREIGGTRKWGSGVLAKDLPLAEINLTKNDYPGALIVADATLPDNSALVVVSMYGQLDDKGYSITTLHRMLSDLTHLFEGKFRKGGSPKIILGGDLNASLQCDAKQGNNSHRIFFQRLEDFGLVDCQGAFSGQRQRTHRHPGSPVPWVNDYIFASESLAKKVVERRVIEEAEMLNLSDHNPVAVTFDL